MSHQESQTKNYISDYIKRVLAFKALRKIRSLVEDFEAEEKRKKRSLKIILLAIIIAPIMFAIYTYGPHDQKGLIYKIDGSVLNVMSINKCNSSVKEYYVKVLLTDGLTVNASVSCSVVLDKDDSVKIGVINIFNTEGGNRYIVI